MTTIAEGLSAVSTALGIVKTLRDIDRDVQEADFKLQIANMTSALAEAKLALVEAEEKNRDMQKETERLSSAVRFRAEETVSAEGFLFRKIEGRPAGRAFCSVCAEEGHFIHVNRVSLKDGDAYTCPRCKANFGWHVPQYLEPSV